MFLLKAKYRALCVLAITGLLFSSCNRYYYQPNAVNVPILKEKDDLSINLNGSSNEEDEKWDNAKNKSSMLNLHAAYSPVKYFGIITTFSNYKYDYKNEDPSTGKVDAHATLDEGGIGGYYPVLKNNYGLKFVADAYTGFGGGKLSSDVNMDFNRLFIQPGINMNFPYCDMGLAARISGKNTVILMPTKCLWIM